MITLTDLRESMKEYKDISEITLYRYIVDLLNTLSNKHLLELALDPDVPEFIRRNAWKILDKRINNINNNGLPHHDAIDDQR